MSGSSKIPINVDGAIVKQFHYKMLFIWVSTEKETPRMRFRKKVDFLLHIRTMSKSRMCSWPNADGQWNWFTSYCVWIQIFPSSTCIILQPITRAWNAVRFISRHTFRLICHYVLFVHSNAYVSFICSKYRWRRKKYNVSMRMWIFNVMADLCNGQKKLFSHSHFYISDDGGTKFNHNIENLLNRIDINARFVFFHAKRM